jgi:hypothetical protein
MINNITVWVHMYLLYYLRFGVQTRTKTTTATTTTTSAAATAATVATTTTTTTMNCDQAIVCNGT